MKNELAGDIALAKGKSQYDTYCKRILANKIILAWILKYVAEEFVYMDIGQIKECIGTDVQVSEANVLPGRANTPGSERIIGESEGDSVPGEGELYYDIRFSVYYARQKQRIKLIINVEAQKEFRHGYSLITRGIFYGARMLSSQKGIEFTGRDYDNIQKNDAIPGIPDEKETYDKISVVMICLNPKSEKGNRLTKMLGILLSPRLETGVKIHQLEHEFDIPMENDMGEELNQMCNLSDYVEELGIEKGIEKHLSQQVKKKLAKGKSIGEIADELEEDEETIRRILKNIE